MSGMLNCLSCKKATHKSRMTGVLCIDCHTSKMYNEIQNYKKLEKCWKVWKKHNPSTDTGVLIPITEAAVRQVFESGFNAALEMFASEINDKTKALKYCQHMSPLGSDVSRHAREVLEKYPR